MNINLKEVPFSIKGSYMAISYIDKEFRNINMKPGLYLRNVHGSSRQPLVAGLIPLFMG